MHHRKHGGQHVSVAQLTHITFWMRNLQQFDSPADHAGQLNFWVTVFEPQQSNVGGRSHCAASQEHTDGIQGCPGVNTRPCPLVSAENLMI